MTASPSHDPRDQIADADPSTARGRIIAGLMEGLGVEDIAVRHRTSVEGVRGVVRVLRREGRITAIVARSRGTSGAVA